MKYRVNYNPPWNEYHLWIIDPDGFEVTMNVTGKKLVPGESTPPVAALCAEEVQGLMDSLWNAGVRPSDLQGIDHGHIAAIKDEVIAAKDAHIGDLRRSLFDRRP